jgi:hypothetical protein
MENTRSNLTTSPGYPWRIFWLFLFLSIFGVAAVLPYVFAIFPKIISSAPLPMSMPIAIVVQLMQSALIFGGLIASSLLLAPKVWIEFPLLQRWLYGKRSGIPGNSFRDPILAGIVGAALTLLIFYTIFLSRIPEWPVAAEAAVPLWKRFLACFYGAINEEILGRLFVFSLILWGLRKIGGAKEGRTGPVIFWITNIIVAILFAAGHIPAAKLVMPITPLVIVALVAMNGGLSLVFGYLCWKRGFEAAMLAHFSADLILHVIGPMFLRA